MHVPLRDRGLLGSLRRASLAVAAPARCLPWGSGSRSQCLGLGLPAVWAILVATGSAAIVLPALEEAGVTADRALLAMAWATVADIVTIVAVPLALQPSHAGARRSRGARRRRRGGRRAGSLARCSRRERAVHELRGSPATSIWALDLRWRSLALFALCASPQCVGTSIMIAGFAAGLIVAIRGRPAPTVRPGHRGRRGFLVPVFFVVLGASLNVRALVTARA